MKHTRHVTTIQPRTQSAVVGSNPGLAAKTDTIETNLQHIAGNVELTAYYFVVLSSGLTAFVNSIA